MNIFLLICNPIVKKVFLFIIILLVLGFAYKQIFEIEKDNSMEIVFYNLENFFDTIDDRVHNDDDFTPNSKLNWNTHKYNLKINKIAKVLMSSDEDKLDLIGVCEIENKNCMNDLIQNQLFNNNYDLIHYDSPDERGIDVGLIYHKKYIKIIKSFPISVKLSSDTNDKTRDLLYVKVVSEKIIDTLNIVVCHFPSRSGGKERSEKNRIDVAKQLKEFIDKLGHQKKWLIMGDFNDEPWDYSVFNILNAKDISHQKSNKNSSLLNLMWMFKNNNQGTYKFKDHWQIIDQMLISTTFLDELRLKKCKYSMSIIQKDWMMQKGNFTGYPYRNYAGNKWLNGYSDHLPIKLKLTTMNE